MLQVYMVFRRRPQKRKRRNFTAAVVSGGVKIIAVRVACGAAALWNEIMGDLLQSTWKGKQKGSCFIEIDTLCWVRDYIKEDPVYPAANFREHLRVHISIFHQVWKYFLVYDATNWDTKRDAIGREDFRREIKVLVCLRLL